LNYQELWKVDSFHKQALREHRVLNSELEKSKRPMGLLLSEDESESILLCGDDHLRMQFILPGTGLHKAWQYADALDNQVNQIFEYAFSEKYGYLTAFPTNVGTGLRASCVLHLPLLSKVRSFKSLQEEIARIGFTLKGVMGSGNDNYGELYRLSNQKTLGQSEEDVIEGVERIALQLAGQERKVRNDAIKSRRNELEDEIYKSFGVMKYARRLTLKETMLYLSQVRLGVCDGIIELDKPINFYGLMLGVQPGSLKVYAGQDLSKNDILQVRADYLREMLPELK
jgi:protein arginine kinase